MGPDRITLDKDREQRGSIKVHSQILNDLSSGIYSSPALCIKELVNNSFDADATRVTVRVIPDEDNILIMDDGVGMNAVEFDSKFAWISKSDKRGESQNSKKGRPLIGKIGIGFIAVNEICEAMEIVSSKENEDVKFKATIDFKSITQPSKTEDAIIKAPYTLINTDEDKEAHYTLIRLVRIKSEAKPLLEAKAYRDHLAQSTRNLKPEETNSLFRSMRELLSHIQDTGIKSLDELNPYYRFLIELSAYTPVEYIDDGPIVGVKDKVIDSIKSEHHLYKFLVDLDGIYLRKPILFFGDEQSSGYLSFVDTIAVPNYESIHIRGYFFAQKTVINPREFNGVSIRIRNIPIAQRFGFDVSLLSYPINIDQIYRHWISGEVYVTKGLEDAMKIDRASFRETHPEYVAIQEWVHRYLKEKVFNQLTNLLYNSAKVKRWDKRDREAEEVMSGILGVNKIKVAEVTSSQFESIVGKSNENVARPLAVVKSGNIASIYINSALRKKFSKNDWRYLQKVFLLFERAFEEGDNDADKIRRLFYQMVNTWLKKKRKDS